MHRTIPITKVCPVCQQEFNVCPPGKNSRVYPKNTQVFCCRECAHIGRVRNGGVCNRLTPEQAAYLAGFFDADGGAILYRRRTKISVRALFTNCNKAVLDWIQEVTGQGGFHKKRATEKSRTGWTLAFNSDAAVSLLEQLLPYLHIKKERAELLIGTRKRLRDRALACDPTWMEDALTKMHLMNKRGH